jgi:hypothetical protein
MEAPVEIEAEKVASFVEKYCKAGKQVDIEKSEEKCIYFDEEKLESAIEYLSKNLPNGTYDDWITIGFGLASLGKKGEEYFVKMSLANPNYKDSEAEVRAKFTGLLNDYDGSTTVKAIYRIAENYGWKKPVIRFWYADERRQVKISRPRIL